MARFRYRAKSATGETVIGLLRAESRRAALSRLEGQGLFPVEVAPALAASGGEPGWRWSRGLRPQQVTEVYRQLADLLEAGVPLLEALASIGAQTSNPVLAEVVAALEADVAEGDSLAVALGRHPRHFSPLEVNLVEAAEAGGFLSEALQRIAEFREKRQALLGRLRAALAYPVAVLTVGLLVVVGLLIWVVPRFEGIFAQMHGVLPAPTRVLLGLSRWLGAYGLLLAVGVAALLVAYRRYRRTERGREFIDRLKLRLPLVGDLVRTAGVARMARTLGLLLGGGVPVLRALAIASGSSGNLVLRRAVESCSDSVREGESLAEPLRQTGVIPPTVVEMIAIGERSARLPAVLERIAESFEARLDRRLNVMTSLALPAMIVVLAGLVGFVVFALLLPVFTLSSLIR